MRFLTRLFGEPEEISGHGRCPTYMYRWTVARLEFCKVYVHRFVGDDWSRDLHDHPKRFVSIGLRGSYLEESPRWAGGFRRYDAPWFRTFPASHRHRITTPFGECWTLVVVFRQTREWGFWHEGRFFGWKDYVIGNKDGIADKMKACD